MAVATAVRRKAFNTGYMGTVNLYVNSSTGISSATPLTVGGNLVLTPIHALPFDGWKCEVTTTPPGSNHLIIYDGETVTG